MMANMVGLEPADISDADDIDEILYETRIKRECSNTNCTRLYI